MNGPAHPLPAGRVGLGIMLALLDMFVISVVLASELAPRGQATPATFPIFAVGVLVAVPCGAFVGWIAGRVHAHRIVTLQVIAVALLPLAGSLAIALIQRDPRIPEAFHAMVVIASVPTALCTVVLERKTRPPPPEAMPLPEARAIKA